MLMLLLILVLMMVMVMVNSTIKCSKILLSYLNFQKIFKENMPIVLILVIQIFKIYIPEILS